MTGVRPLLRFRLRCDRGRLLAWTAGFGLFAVYLTTALPALAGDSDLQGLAALLDQPIGRLFVGPAYGLDAVTLPRFLAGGYLLYFTVLAGLMGILVTVRHTRAEEDHHRADLLAAQPVDRGVPLLVAVLLAGLYGLLGGAVTTGVLLTAGYPPTGAWLSGAGMTATTLAYSGITVCSALALPTARAAGGAAGALLGLSCALRGVGDLLRTGGSALSWTNPLGWASQTAPFTLDRGWPLLFSLGVWACGVSVAAVWASRRSLGTSLWPDRSTGVRTAAPPLHPTVALWRLWLRGLHWGWLGGLVVFSVLCGAFTQALSDTQADLPSAFHTVLGAGDLTASYLAYLARCAAWGMTACGLMMLSALSSEEERGGIDVLTAAGLTRTRLYATAVGLIAVSTAAGVLVTAAATGAAAAAVTGDPGLIAVALAAGLNLLTPLWVVLAVAACLLGILPHLARPVGWIVWGTSVVLTQVGALLHLPQWLVDLSPYAQVGRVPVDAPSSGPQWVLVGVSLLLLVVGWWGFTRRSLR